MSVPNTSTFSLIDVTTELDGGETSLQACFDNSIESGFDPTYNNDGYSPANNQLRFRNYSHVDMWHISQTVYNSVSFYVPGFDMDGLTFKSDGSAFYTIDDSFNTVNKYNLTTNWDLSNGASVSSDSFALTNTSRGRSIFITTDGVHMYITDYSGNISCDHYIMSTPWLLSSSTYSDQFLSPTNLVYAPYVTDDGSLMFLTEINGITRKYSLSTAHNPSSASLVQTGSRGSGWFTICSGWNPNGWQMFSINTTTLIIEQYNLSSEYNISDLTTVAETADLDDQGVTPPFAAPFGISFKPDGSRYWVVDSTNETIHQFDF